MNCLVCGEGPIKARGRCNRCYLCYRRSETFERVQAPRGLRCTLCGKPVSARGLCHTHYMRWYMQRYREEIRDAR